jgi:hypothetical protein
LPDVRLLDIQNAEIGYLSGDEQEIKLTDFNLTVKDFSSKKGGHISFRSNFSYKTGADTRTSVKGKVSAMVQLEGFYPIPYGKGKIDLAVDSGEYRSGGRFRSTTFHGREARLRQGHEHSQSTRWMEEQRV